MLLRESVGPDLADEELGMSQERRGHPLNSRLEVVVWFLLLVLTTCRDLLGEGLL